MTIEQQKQNGKKMAGRDESICGVDNKLTD